MVNMAVQTVFKRYELKYLMTREQPVSYTHLAALVIPATFSEDMVSFLGGDLEHPQIIYYENLYSMFEDSKDYRDSMPNSSAGPIKKRFAVYCDIIDEAGGIATIATILASNLISIKNIGIVHNREFEEGVLRIEFYDETSSGRAAELLKKYRYVVYEV